MHTSSTGMLLTAFEELKLKINRQIFPTLDVVFIQNYVPSLESLHKAYFSSWGQFEFLQL